MTTDTPTAVTHDAPAAPRRRWFGPLVAGDLAALWPAIVVAFLGVLGIAFGMSFHGLFVFGELVMTWALGLCIAGPIGLDVFSMLCLIATFLTRDAAWRIRSYCWLALLGTVAVSITGNAISAYALLDADAARRGTAFTWGYQQVSAVIGAAFWPALAAIALHVLIVVRRHLDEVRDTARQDVAEAAAAEAVEQVQRGRAIELAASGTTVPDILTDLGLEETQRRTVERWTKPVRDAVAARPAAVAAKQMTRRAINGRAPNGEQA